MPATPLSAEGGVGLVWSRKETLRMRACRNARTIGVGYSKKVIRKRSKRALRLVLASFLLQTAIPLGYMPASIEDGWFVKLCPNGLSAAWVSALLGDQHKHHSDDESVFAQCDLGGGLGNPVALSDFAGTAAYSAPESILPVSDYLPATGISHYRPRPRSPPVSPSI